MKNIVFLILIISISQTGYSQSYTPYLDSTSTWYETFGSAGIGGIYISNNKYYFDGDTSLIGYNYYKLYIDAVDSTWDFFSGSFLGTNTYSHIYQLAIREDSLKKFYFYHSSQAVDTLLFDFSLELGDTVPEMISIQGCNNPPKIISAIDTVYLGAQTLKKIIIPGGFQSKAMYEGIGATGGLFWQGSLCEGIESGACLIAYRKGSDSLFINCGLGITGINTLEEKICPKIYPNPTTDQISIETKGLTNPVLFFYDIYGKELSKIKLRTENNIIQLSSAYLGGGVYVWKLESDNFPTSFGKLIVTK